MHNSAAHSTQQSSRCVSRRPHPEATNVEKRGCELLLVRRYFRRSVGHCGPGGPVRGAFAQKAGVCGKAGLEALHVRGCSVDSGTAWLTPALVTSLPEKLRAAQSVFQSTGGLHAAALFDAAGELQALREDVGRHNAVDKLLGWALLQGKLPLANHIVLVSGR